MKQILSKLKIGVSKLIGVSMFVLIATFVAAGVGYFRWQSQMETNVDADNESGSLVERIKEPGNSPHNEEPVIVRITDITLLPQNTFFKNAQNNDIVIIYPIAKVSYLYRESTNEVIAEVLIDDNGMPIHDEDIAIDETLR